MQTFTTFARILVTLSTTYLMVACADRPLDGTDAPNAQDPSLSLGVAAQGVSGYPWQIAQVADVNFDGMADVIWNDPTQNLMAVWLMNGDRLLAPGPFIPGPAGADWIAATSADFNFDGMADVLWNNPKQNLAAVWLMNGDRLLAPGPPIPGPIGADWVTVPSAGDFNFDGMADIVWNNPKQNLMAVWLMNGDRLLSAGPFIPGPAGAGWIAITLADFNYDGMADIVWNNVSQNLMAIWLMNGDRLLAPGPFIPGPAGAGWAIVPSAADFNYDGMADVMWTNSNQSLAAVWLMNGDRLLAAGPNIPGPALTGWAVATAGDCNYDGMADAVWKAAGANGMAVWLMNGSRLLTPGPIIPGPP